MSTLAFADNGIHNTEIVVFRNEMVFERPARGHLDVRAYLKPDDFQACRAELLTGEGAHVRYDVHVGLFHDGERCARMRGLYVVWLK